MPEPSSNPITSSSTTRPPDCDILIVGGGSAGLGAAASLLRRRPGLAVTIVEPSEQHYYQPGWTLVGAGVFDPGQTVRPTAQLIPKGATWLKAAVRGFHPQANEVELEDGYKHFSCWPSAEGNTGNENCRSQGYGTLTRPISSVVR